MIVFSILNRLVKDPDADPVSNGTQPRDRRSLRTRDAEVTRAEFEKYRETVRRDLKWLLNTRRIAAPVPDGLREIERSVYCYGLPDFSQMRLQPGRSEGDQFLLAGIITRTIELFEPRILGVQVTVDRPRDSKELRFRISGRLKMKPRPEPIHYDTMLDVKSGEYAVEVPGEVHA